MCSSNFLRSGLEANKFFFPRVLGLLSYQFKVTISHYMSIQRTVDCQIVTDFTPSPTALLMQGLESCTGYRFYRVIRMLSCLSPWNYMEVHWTPKPRWIAMACSSLECPGRNSSIVLRISIWAPNH